MLVVDDLGTSIKFHRQTLRMLVKNERYIR